MYIYTLCIYIVVFFLLWGFVDVSLTHITHSHTHHTHSYHIHTHYTHSHTHHTHSHYMHTHTSLTHSLDFQNIVYMKVVRLTHDIIHVYEYVFYMHG